MDGWMDRWGLGMRVCDWINGLGLGIVARVHGSLRTEGAEDDEREAPLLFLGVRAPPDAEPDREQDLCFKRMDGIVGCV
jgi:hypothetical protein